MKNRVLVYVIRFFLLVLLQVGVLNHINFFGYIDPFLYIWFLLMLPFETPRWLLLCVGFVLGMCVDIFAGEYGFHAAAATPVAFLRPLVIRLISTPMELNQVGIPHVRTMGIRWYTIYAFFMVFLHTLSYFLLEIFRFSELHLTLLRALLSAVITVVMIIGGEYICFRKKS